ncbi:nicotinamidase-like amidase [Aciduliprofundum sp. MAR08-339]|uniref:cysteine hydrolase family protein n=1 Tax=Aciduliprofundum sp. (strain MAR08-339) TaxID=673860 RepID=UPI0002A4C4A7|nr:nicotinamidase-like amidase [Aciduliprofundum sp. MAR08-339]
MRALLVVDMIHDFVDGKFGSAKAKSIVPVVAKLIEKFRNDGMVIYLKDSHSKGDAELSIWGQHAMEGTWGSEIVKEIEPKDGDVVIEKNTYDGFLFTDLERILIDAGVEEVHICGVATDICVQHTAFGAFARGFKVHIIKDACAGTSEEEHERALKYMERIYGARIEESEQL